MSQDLFAFPERGRRVDRTDWEVSKVLTTDTFLRDTYLIHPSNLILAVFHLVPSMDKHTCSSVHYI